MSLVTNEIEYIASEAGLTITEKDGHIKVWDMSKDDSEPLVAWYYLGDFREAATEAIAEEIPSAIETEDDAELLIEILINIPL
ncbi:MAG: hypothetical protein JKY62_17050 [Desulfocapsa sp.]|nr:hypothetical protein [Desulfocapsa sp.]